MELTSIRNMKHMADFAAAEYGGKVYMEYLKNGAVEKKTFVDFKKAADAVSLMLRDRLPELARPHAALIGASSFAWVAFWFGTAAVGGVNVPLATAETDDMNLKLIDFADTDVFVFEKKHEALYKKVREELPRVKLFVALDDSGDGREVLNFSDILRDYQGEYDSEPDGQDVAAICFTSGTTGFPKGVMLTHRNFVMTSTSEHVECAGVRKFSLLPINHCYSFVINFTKTLSHGLTVIINDDFTRLYDNIRFFKPDHIVCVPAILKKMMGDALAYAASKPELTEQQAVKEFFGGHVVDIASGGAPLEAAAAERFNATGIYCFNGYGMTECAPVISKNSLYLYRHGSVGMPIPCATVRIADNGEIQVKGENVMKGYYKNPEATAAAFTEDGFLHTGDIGHYDDDGFLYVTGRLKNLILLDNGENVSAEYVEDKFAGEPLVKEVVCFGDDGAIYAEIFPDLRYAAANGITDVNKEMPELLMRVNRNLAAFQKVSGYVLRDKPFERTASSKIKRGSHGKAVKPDAVSPSNDAEQRVYDAVTSTLPVRNVSMTDNFFAIGGDSLTAVELSFKLGVNVQLIYDKPFLSALAAALISAGGEDEKIDGINDILRSTESDAPDSGLKFGTALLTGATGFLGVHILRQLSDAGLRVFALVRNEQKLSNQLRYYFGVPELDGVTPVLGNIESERLGVTDSVYKKLLDEVDVVFHVAANVSHAGDYEDLERTNVKGTENVIAFCLESGAVMQHTSTVSVHGAATTRQTDRNAVFDEHILDIGQRFTDNVYIHSKYVAEQAVITARERGLKANIFRIGNLTWRASDGIFQRNSRDNGFLARVRAIVKLGTYHENSDKYPMDITPVDECADAYVRLALSGRVNEVFHMYNPNFIGAFELLRMMDAPCRLCSQLEQIETIFANQDDKDLRVYMFYLLISTRSQNIPMFCDKTVAELEELGFRWSVPDGAYMKSCNDGEGHYFLKGLKADLKPMRATGGALNPVGEMILSVFRSAKLKENVLRSGSVADIPAFCDKLRIKRPFIITVDVFEGTEWLDDIRKEFPGCVIYTELKTEPALCDIDFALAEYADHGCDGVIGIGGGSVLDTAKVTALMCANPGRDARDIAKVDSRANAPAPLILAPTTAGTGAEATIYAMLYEPDVDMKSPLTSDRFLPDAVVLDGSLTRTLPGNFMAYSGIDALSHAVEAQLSLFAPAMPEDRKFAPEAAKLIFENLPDAVADSVDLTARSNMLVAANTAGRAFGRISTGYIHAIAHRLGEFYNVPHGLAIATVFTTVLRAYGKWAYAGLSELARYCGIAGDSDTDEAAAGRFIDAVDRLIAKTGAARPKVKIDPDDVPLIVLRAQAEARGLGLPRPFSDAELAEIVLRIRR